MRERVAVVVRLAVLLGIAAPWWGCAGVQPEATREDPRYAGDPDAPPAVAVLPELVREPKQVAERMHTMLAMANEIFAKKLPEPPTDRAYASLSTWVHDVVTPWLETRHDAIDEVRFQASREGSELAEQVINAAVIGLLHEDTALELERIPAPSELDREPEVAAMFRDIIRVQAKPFVGSALREYRYCANTGYRATEELLRFARFCHARHDRLRDAYDLEGGASPAGKPAQ